MKFIQLGDYWINLSNVVLIKVTPARETLKVETGFAGYDQEAKRIPTTLTIHAIGQNAFDLQVTDEDLQRLKSVVD